MFWKCLQQQIYIYIKKVWLWGINVDVSEKPSLTRCQLRLESLTGNKMIISTTNFTFSTTPCGIYRAKKQVFISGFLLLMYAVPVLHSGVFRVLRWGLLTRYSACEALWLVVEESLSKLCLPAAGWANQSDRTLPICWLVIQSHLLIGENFLIEIWTKSKDIS